MDKKKREKRCATLWVDIDFNIDTQKKHYGRSETNSFYDLQDPKDGYVVRGIGPVSQKIVDPAHDAY